MSRHIFSIFCANTQTALISSLTAAIIIFQFGLQEMTIPALAQATTDDFTNYENPTYGINMLYPSDWTQSVNPLQSYTIPSVIQCHKACGALLFSLQQHMPIDNRDSIN